MPMKVLPWLGLTLVLGSIAQAAVPVFQDGTLHLDAVATLGPDGNHYYRDVQLRREADGTLKVAAAEPRPLVEIQKVEAVLIAAAGLDTEIQASVHIKGITSVACVALEEPAQTRVGNTFNVVVAETVMEPGAVCASLLPNSPFDLSLPLDVAQLPAGNYTVEVNGVTDTFTLP